MNRTRSLFLAGLAVVVLVVAAIVGWRVAARSAPRVAGATPSPQAAGARPGFDLAHQLLIVDTHIDLPDFIFEHPSHLDEVGGLAPRGDFDAERARRGGLDVAWMSIYVPVSYQQGDGAASYADGLIDLVERLVARYPDRFAIATDPDQATDIAESGKIALAMGMENGAGIEGDLGNLQHFYDRGIRYVTLVHGADNRLGDSSYSDPATRRWHGLSPFGVNAVREMNRLGILVDLSHVSDETFDQALATTVAPPIASHSSCRYFTPGFERNLDDARIQALAAKGGVIQIAFGSVFLTPDANAWSQAHEAAEAEFVERTGAKDGTAELDDFERRYGAAHPYPRATVDNVVTHIDHVVKLVGIDHVGIGSDFDGVGPTTPTGLEDVSKYPNLVTRLLERGYDRESIAKILGGNILRVWRQAAQVAAELQAKASPVAKPVVQLPAPKAGLG